MRSVSRSMLRGAGAVLGGMILLMGLACSVAEETPSRASPPSPGPNVILISLDTLRADRLGCYGNPSPTSPFLDRLARRGLMAASAISQSPLTAPSHMTLFTSRFPTAHGVENISAARPVHRLSAGIPTLAETFRGAGYRTLACTDGGNVAAALGFDRGFDLYLESGAEAFLGLARLEPREPWFAFLHTYWVHDPYLAPDLFVKLFDPRYDGGIQGSLESLGEEVSSAHLLRYRDRFWRTVDFSDPRDREHLFRLYDATIRVVDLGVRRVVDMLREQQSLERTVLILTSDHGEELLEHGRILHERTYRETLEVPLVVVDFRRETGGRLLPESIPLVDLAPTLLDYLNLPPLPGAQGMSRVAALRGEPCRPETIHARAFHPYFSEMTLQGSWKYIRNPAPSPLEMPRDPGPRRPPVSAEELYHLVVDPGEQHDLSAEHPDLLERLRLLADEHAMRTKGSVPQEPPVPAEVDPETLERIRALGYVGS